MRRILLAVAFLGFLAVPGANAQGEQLAPELAIGFPYVDSADGKIPFRSENASVVAPWTLTFPNAASASAAFGGRDNIIIAWVLNCTDAEIMLLGPKTFEIAFVP